MTHIFEISDREARINDSSNIIANQIFAAIETVLGKDRFELERPGPGDCIYSDINRILDTHLRLWF